MEFKCVNFAIELWRIFIIIFLTILDWMSWYFFRNLIDIYIDLSVNIISRILQKIFKYNNFFRQVEQNNLKIVRYKPIKNVTKMFIFQ